MSPQGNNWSPKKVRESFCQLPGALLMPDPRLPLGLRLMILDTPHSNRENPHNDPGQAEACRSRNFQRFQQKENVSMDAVLLARIQFALTIGFHYLYPPLSIGLGVILVIAEGLYLRTRNVLYLNMTKFWAKIFGLTFALGVATGIVMEFEFGTNWAAYSRFVGDVFGSPLAAEGIFAFFLESSFLGVVLFGWNRVSPKFHFFATCMVALGATLSALWIVAANSWMQTPAGYEIVHDGIGLRAQITDFWAMVLNPSSVDRFTHVIAGAWQAGAWFTVSVSAFYLLRKTHLDFAKACMKIGLVFALVAALAQLATGHSSAIGVSKYQPAKLAAFEGHYDSHGPAAMYLFGWVDEKNEKVRLGIALPKLLSFLVHFDPDKPVTGLDAFAESERPPVNIVFQTYHLMIAIGMGLIGLAFLGIFLWWRGSLFENRWVLMLMTSAFLGPQIANQTGWMAAEIGRQPWIVYQLLRTADGVSKTVSAGEILISILMFTAIYILLFLIYVYLMAEKILKGPEPATGKV